MVQKRTYCRNCAANCGLVVDVEDNQIKSVTTDRDHSLTRGYACIKGMMAGDLHNGAENRLMSCMKRDESGRFVEIDKRQATNEVLDKISDIIQKHGPRALGFYFGTYSYFDSVGKTFLKNIASDLGIPAVFSSMTIDQSSKWVTAGRMGVWANSKPTSVATDVILVVGCNPSVSHQGYPMVPYSVTNISGAIRDAKKREVKLIVIDPRRTELARRADLHIQPKPGYDAAIFAAMIRLIVKNDSYEKDFVGRWTTNFDKLVEAVEPFTLKRVANAADIDASSIEQAVEWLVTAKKPGLGNGTGVGMTRFSNTAEHLFEALTGLVGGYIRAGEEIPNPGVFFPRPEVETVYPPNRTWEQSAKCASDENFGKLMGEFPTSLLPDEIMHEGENGIRALVVIGGNPIAALGEPARVSKAFDKLDLLVVFDPRLQSTTAQKADYVMAPVLQFERAEVTSFTEFAFDKPFVQYTPAVKTPPEGTLGEDEFAWLLAKKLGIDLNYKYMPFGANYEDLPKGIDVDMEQYQGREHYIKWLVNQTEVSFEQLQDNPSGITLNKSKILKEPESDDGMRLDYCPADVSAEIAEVHETLEQSNNDFLLCSRRFLESYNSSFLGHETTRKRHPVNQLHMHPDDMALLEIKNGDAVQLANDTGALSTYVKPDKSMKQGVVSMAHGWGVPADQLDRDPNGLQGAQTGFLVSLTENLQSVNRMPLQTGIRVQIMKKDGNLEQLKAVQ